MASTTLLILGAHALADFPLQTDRMAAEKFDDVGVRIRHVTVHQAFLTAALVLAGQPLSVAVPFGSAATIAHFVIDARRWAEPKPEFEDYPIWVDQSLHVASLAVIHAVVVALV
jgi:hypothetical protein